jgi:hypothetical protein
MGGGLRQERLGESMYAMDSVAEPWGEGKHGREVSEGGGKGKGGVPRQGREINGSAM